MTAYPIVARRDDRICLIIMRKVNSQWVVSTANEQALVRDELVLKAFSVDEHYSELEHTLYVYFDFEDETGNAVTLSLHLSDIYPSYFSLIHRSNVSMVLNYDRGITVRFDFPFLFSVAYEISPEQYIPFDVDAFSFSDCLLTIEELFAPSLISPQKETAGLYVLPDNSMEPVFHLQQGESITVIRQQLQTDWGLGKLQRQFVFCPRTGCIYVQRVL